MDNEQIINECVICGKIQIDNFWYPSTKSPPHSMHLKGAICDECWAHRLNKRKMAAVKAES